MDPGSSAIGIETLTSHYPPIPFSSIPGLPSAHDEQLERGRSTQVRESLHCIRQDDLSFELYENPNGILMTDGSDTVAPSFMPLEQGLMLQPSFLTPTGSSMRSSNYTGYGGTEATAQVGFGVEPPSMSWSLGGQETFPIEQDNLQQNTMLGSQGFQTGPYWVQSATIRRPCALRKSTSFGHTNGMATNNSTSYRPNSYANATTNQNTLQYQPHSLPSNGVNHFSGPSHNFSGTSTMCQIPPGCIGFNSEQSERLNKGEYVYADCRFHSKAPLPPPPGYMAQTPEYNDWYRRNIAMQKRKRESFSSSNLGISPSPPTEERTPPAPNLALSNLPAKELSSSPNTNIKEERSPGNTENYFLHECCGINFQNSRDFNNHQLEVHEHFLNTNEASPIGEVPFEFTDDLNKLFDELPIEEFTKMFE